ncbi:Mu-like prophage I protein, partial [Rhodobacter viridis]
MTINPGAVGRTGAPAWVHLFPPGKIEGRDGRRYVLSNPAAVMRGFEQRGVDLPVDYEHQSETTEARMRGPVPAAGWIKELRLEDTGLWGRVVACCRFRGHEDKIVTKETEIGHGETEVHEGVQ